MTTIVTRKLLNLCVHNLYYSFVGLASGKLLMNGLEETRTGILIAPE